MQITRSTRMVCVPVELHKFYYVRTHLNQGFALLIFDSIYYCLQWRIPSEMFFLMFLVSLVDSCLNSVM